MIGFAIGRILLVEAALLLLPWQVALVMGNPLSRICSLRRCWCCAEDC